MVRHDLLSEMSCHAVVTAVQLYTFLKSAHYVMRLYLILKSTLLVVRDTAAAGGGEGVLTSPSFTYLHSYSTRYTQNYSFRYHLRLMGTVR